MVCCSLWDLEKPDMTEQLSNNKRFSNICIERDEFPSLCLHSTVFLYIMFLVSFTSNILVSWWVVSGPRIVDFGAYQSWTPECKSWQVPVLVLACQYVKQRP